LGWTNDGRQHDFVASQAAPLQTMIQNPVNLFYHLISSSENQSETASTAPKNFVIHL
jgi:hypothetical protein